MPSVLLAGLPFRDIKGQFPAFRIGPLAFLTDETGAVLIDGTGAAFIIQPRFPTVPEA